MNKINGTKDGLKMHSFCPVDLTKDSVHIAERTDVDRCLILQYHIVASLSHDPLQLAVEPYHFEMQMESLAQDFNVISIEQMKQHLETASPFRKKSVVVTFDGGFSDVLYTAKELLESYGIFSTVFAVTGNIIEKGRYWWQELEDLLIANNTGGQLELKIENRFYQWPLRTQFDKFRAYDNLFSILSGKTPSEQKAIISQVKHRLQLKAEEIDNHRTMDAGELKQLESSGLITVGGHTHDYVKLSSLSKSQQAEEILKNKNVLEEVLGHNIEYFSYPFGTNHGYTAETMSILEDIGFSLACGNSYGMVSLRETENRYDLPRVKVGNWNSFVFYRFLRRFFD